MKKTKTKTPPKPRLPLHWKLHTPNILEEILKNPGTQLLHRPLQLLGSLLASVGERASELNDPKLNALMVRLTIYSIAEWATLKNKSCIRKQVALKWQS